MRTTLTLDPDVARRAKAATARSGKPFKQVINEALRAGLDALEQRPKKAKPYRMKPHKLGLREGLSYDNISELISYAEGEDWR
jgi:hypothetical protein